jgi:hypothetical protein
MIGDALWYPMWDDSHVQSTGSAIAKVLGGKGKIGNTAVLTPVPPPTPKPAQTIASTATSPAPSLSVSQEKSSSDSREENSRLSKELSIARAYILLTDEKKIKTTELAVLKQYLDDQGIDDPSVLR